MLPVFLYENSWNKINKHPVNPSATTDCPECGLLHPKILIDSL